MSKISEQPKTKDRNYLNYWGKHSNNLEYHPVAYHSLDVAAVLSEIISCNDTFRQLLEELRFLPREHVVPFTLFLASLHDIGKFSIGFQNLKPDLFHTLQGKESAVRYSVRHDSAGFLLLSEIFPEYFFKPEEFPQFMWDPNYYNDDWWDLLSPLICASTGHHGVPPEIKNDNLLFKTYYPSDVIDDICAFCQDCADLFLPPDSNIPIAFSFSGCCIHDVSFALAGAIVLSDWIASSDIWFSYVTKHMPLKEYWDTYAQPQAKKAIIESDIVPAPVSSESGFSYLFPTFTLHPMQRVCDEVPLSDGPELFIIEEECGKGKTESALVLAHRLMKAKKGNGFFFSLPTMATANAMHDRIMECYAKMYAPESDPQVVLTHSLQIMPKKSKSLFSDECVEKFGESNLEGDETDGADQAHYWLLDSKKKALLAHVGVGTIDQVLMAVLPLRHQSLRVFGLMRNVLVIDEVHAYDPYMHTLLQHLIELHASLGGSIILLSATLPLSSKRDLVLAFQKGIGIPENVERKAPSSLVYPLLTSCSREKTEEIDPLAYTKSSSGKDTMIRVSVIHSMEEVIAQVEQALSEDKCIVYIRNTVSDAREAFSVLADRFGSARTFLFHARFTLFDRLKHEENVRSLFGKKSTIEERKGRILVATQVIEQSLDVDFDVMITDLAPADLLIQRVGRVHRHDLPEPYRLKNRGLPQLIIRAPPVDFLTSDWYEDFSTGAAFVYPDHGGLYLSLEAFTKGDTVTFPQDLRDIIEYVYDDESISRIPEALLSARVKSMGEDNTDITIAKLNALPRHRGYSFKGDLWGNDVQTPTRLSELSHPVFLGKYENGIVHPLYGSGADGWIKSMVSVRDALLPKEKTPEFDEKELGIPMKSKYCILLIMESQNDRWRGVAGDVEVYYDNNVGFVVESN